MQESILFLLIFLCVLLLLVFIFNIIIIKFVLSRFYPNNLKNKKRKVQIEPIKKYVIINNPGGQCISLGIESV